MIAYDFDGVLAQAPPESKKAWRRMNGEERKARRAFLLAWYEATPPLFIPDVNVGHFEVITARSEWAREVSLAWLQRRYPYRTGLHMLGKTSRTIENVVAFKADVLRRFGVTDYHEDNRAVVRGLRRAVPTCRVWHYKGGRMLLDYPEAPL